MWHKPKISDYDGTDFLPYQHDLQRLSRYHIDDYKPKEFLKDLTRDKEHWIIRFLNVFLYAGMMFVDWLGGKLKHEKKE